jgi:drug/metabolite transporter (DMT)-like permease
MSATNKTPPRSTQPRSALTQAILWMGVALLSFSAIAIAGREGGKAMTTTELIFWRSVLGVAVLSAIYLRNGGLAAARSTLMPLHAGRALVHYAAQWAWLYAVTLIPLTELFALEFTAPLWVAILAPVVLAEKLTPARMGAAIVGFCGALIVAEPGILDGRLQLSASTGTIAAALSAIGFASSMLCTKRLTRTDPALRILFWMQVLQAVIAAVVMIGGTAKSGIMPASLTGAIPLAAWGWVALLGIAGLTAHFGLTRAFGLVDAIVVAPMDFLRLPLIAVVGAVVYGEQLALALALGAGIVMAANALNLWAERRARAALAP